MPAKDNFLALDTIATKLILDHNDKIQFRLATQILSQAKSNPLFLPCVTELTYHLISGDFIQFSLSDPVVRTLYHHLVNEMIATFPGICSSMRTVKSKVYGAETTLGDNLLLSADDKAIFNERVVLSLNVKNVLDVFLKTTENQDPQEYLQYYLKAASSLAHYQECVELKRNLLKIHSKLSNVANTPSGQPVTLQDWKSYGYTFNLVIGSLISALPQLAHHFNNLTSQRQQIENISTVLQKVAAQQDSQRKLIIDQSAGLFDLAAFCLRDFLSHLVPSMSSPVFFLNSSSDTVPSEIKRGWVRVMREDFPEVTPEFIDAALAGYMFFQWTDYNLPGRLSWIRSTLSKPEFSNWFKKYNRERTSVLQQAVAQVADDQSTSVALLKVLPTFKKRIDDHLARQSEDSKSEEAKEATSRSRDMYQDQAIIEQRKQEFEFLLDVEKYELLAQEIYDDIELNPSRSDLGKAIWGLNNNSELVEYTYNKFNDTTTHITENRVNLSFCKFRYEILAEKYNAMKTKITAKNKAENQFFTTHKSLPTLHENLANLVAEETRKLTDAKDELLPLIPLRQAIVIFNRYATDIFFCWHHHRNVASNIVSHLLTLLHNKNLTPEEKNNAGKHYIENARSVLHEDDALKVHEYSGFLHALHYVIETVFASQSQYKSPPLKMEG